MNDSGSSTDPLSFLADAEARAFSILQPIIGGLTIKEAVFKNRLDEARARKFHYQGIRYFSKHPKTVSQCFAIDFLQSLHLVRQSILKGGFDHRIAGQIFDLGVIAGTFGHGEIAFGDFLVSKRKRLNQDEKMMIEFFWVIKPSKARFSFSEIASYLKKSVRGDKEKKTLNEDSFRTKLKNFRTKLKYDLKFEMSERKPVVTFKKRLFVFESPESLA